MFEWCERRSLVPIFGSPILEKRSSVDYRWGDGVEMMVGEPVTTGVKSFFRFSTYVLHESHGGSDIPTLYNESPRKVS